MPTDKFFLVPQITATEKYIDISRDGMERELNDENGEFIHEWEESLEDDVHQEHVVTLIEEEPIKTRVQRSLDRWKPNYVRQINRNVIVKGHKADHSFDFVSFPEDPSANTVAIQILAPSHSPQAQAERYGFLVLDVEGKPPYEMWRRFAIITKAENWGEKPLTLVRALSQQTATLKTGDEEAVERLIPPIMESLSKAA